MFLKFISEWGVRQPVAPETLQVGLRTVPLLVVRNPRARRYLLRVQPDGAARLTIPRGGSRSAAQSFVDQNRAWLEHQIEILHARPRLPLAWRAGSEILFRGEKVCLEILEGGSLRVGAENLTVNDASGDLR